MDSLYAMELCQSISSSLGIDLPTTAVFDYPSIPSLTAHLTAIMTDTDMRIPVSDRISARDLVTSRQKLHVSASSILSQIIV